MADQNDPSLNPQPGLKEKLSVNISRNIPYITAWIIRRLIDLLLGFKKFIIQLFQDATSR
jgi:hypothetical protein